MKMIVQWFQRIESNQIINFICKYLFVFNLIHKEDRNSWFKTLEIIFSKDDSDYQKLN
jgi:hypothetical protein